MITHINAVPYNPETDVRIGTAVACLILHLDLSAQIYVLTSRDKPPWPEPERLQALRTDLKRDWDLKVRPRVTGVLRTAGLKATPVMILCPGFGTGGYYKYRNVCLSWATEDSGDAFADLWFHYRGFHQSIQDESADAEHDVRMMFRMHQQIQGVRA